MLNSVRVVYIFLLSILVCNLAAGFRHLSQKQNIIRSRGSDLNQLKPKQQATYLRAAQEVIQGVGDEGCLLPSPSRVNTKPQIAQAAIVMGIFAGLFAGTAGLVSLYAAAANSIPFLLSWKSTWPILGPIYVAAGAAHFSLKDDFINIYPRKGAWGIWYLPGSAGFHVVWTGVAEILGGLWLALGGLSDALFLPLPNSLVNSTEYAALVLLLLTVAVTPANIYMYTHGARLPIKSPEVPVSGHVVRGVLQIILFAQFYIMGPPAIQNIF